MASQNPLSRNKIFYAALSLCGTLLSIIVGFAWSRLEAHETQLGDQRVELKELQTKRESDHALLLEMRQDVKEIRDSTRRMEGLNASRGAP